jgi:outer membrane protein W
MVKGRIRPLILIVVLMLIASPALAEKGDSKLRFGLQWVSPTGDYTESEPGMSLTIEADDALGGFVGYEYLLSDLIGIGATLSFAGHDVKGKIEGPGGFSESATIGDIFVTPLTFDVNFHVVQSQSIDFFLGLNLGYVSLSKLTVDGEGDVSIKNTTAAGATAGIDVPFGEGKWMFSGALQYLSFGAEVDESGADATVDIDPLVVRVGVGVKF